MLRYALAQGLQLDDNTRPVPLKLLSPHPARLGSLRRPPLIQYCNFGAIGFQPDPQQAELSEIVTRFMKLAATGMAYAHY